MYIGLCAPVEWSAGSILGSQLVRDSVALGPLKISMGRRPG